MNGEHPQAWTGASGEHYHFYIYDRRPIVPSCGGIYVYAGKTSEGHWAPLFMGYGDLSKRANHDKALIAKLEAKGAVAVHLRLNPDPADGAVELEDLLKMYRNVYEPAGCQPLPPGGLPELPPAAALVAGGAPPVAEVSKAAPEVASLEVKVAKVKARARK